jgi:hypothetical protein
MYLFTRLQVEWRLPSRITSFAGPLAALPLLGLETHTIKHEALNSKF